MEDDSILPRPLRNLVRGWQEAQLQLAIKKPNLYSKNLHVLAILILIGQSQWGFGGFLPLALFISIIGIAYWYFITFLYTDEYFMGDMRSRFLWTVFPILMTIVQPFWSGQIGLIDALDLATLIAIGVYIAVNITVLVSNRVYFGGIDPISAVGPFALFVSPILVPSMVFIAGSARFDEGQKNVVYGPAEPGRITSVDGLITTFQGIAFLVVLVAIMLFPFVAPRTKHWKGKIWRREVPYFLTYNSGHFIAFVQATVIFSGLVWALLATEFLEALFGFSIPLLILTAPIMWIGLRYMKNTQAAFNDLRAKHYHNYY